MLGFQYTAKFIPLFRGPITGIPWWKYDLPSHFSQFNDTILCQFTSLLYQKGLQIYVH